jgi:hypothetical protein
LKDREVKLQKCAEYRKQKKAEIQKYHQSYYLTNKDRLLERTKEYRDRPDVKEREATRQKMYYAARSAEIQAKRKAATDANPERATRFGLYLKQHYLANKAHYIAKGAKRRATKVSATPGWADLKAIRQIYQLAEKLSLSTGVKHNVDHVIPLRGKKVSGLHVENNLQVIPERENKSKANKFIEG